MRNAFITLILLAFAFFLWPYIAVFNLYVTLKTGDVEGVRQRVDWYVFKKDLRTNLDNLVKIKLEESLNKKKMAYSFDSLTLSKKIDDQIATPEGLIYIFNKPDKFIEQIRQIFSNELPPENINPPVPKKKSFQTEAEAPNLPNLFERIKYAFFTKPYSFRLILKEGNFTFTMDWQLKGLFWKLIRLKIPIKKI